MAIVNFLKTKNMKKIIIIASVLISSHAFCQRTKISKKPEKVHSLKVNIGCDSATKAFNVMYWKTQCERIKHHNEVLPEETEPLPILSADSCLVEFLY